MPDRITAPAVARNRDPILEVLRGVLPESGTVLEIASGSGEHVIHFAQHFPQIEFHPTDPDERAVASIKTWVKEAGLPNIAAPLMFDVTEAKWPFRKLDGIICINMIHISPWRATEALMRGAASALKHGAPLYLYGPYRRRNIPTAPSNEQFDTYLRTQNAEWGLRNLEIVSILAQSVGFLNPEITDMPANNLSVVFRRS
jgi:SAM-dependent methyltransferase